MRRFFTLLAIVGVSVYALTGMAVAASNQEILVAKGHVGGYHWLVAAAQDEGREGICFEVGTFKGNPRNGVNGGGQCSAPAAKRGILLTATEPGARPGRLAMTVVGAAFNQAVKSVKVTSFDGQTKRLTPRPVPRSRTQGSTVANFRYLAFAVRGPWCAESMVTLAANGKPLWEASWEEIGGHRKAHDPRSQCPGF